MTQYQYKQRSVEAGGLERYLNEQGRSGWRVKFVEHGLIGNYLVLLERPGQAAGKRKNGGKAS